MTALVLRHCDTERSEAEAIHITNGQTVRLLRCLTPPRNDVFYLPLV